MKIDVVDRIVLAQKGKVTSFMNYLFRVNSRLNLKNEQTDKNLFFYQSQVHYENIDDDIREEQRKSYYAEFLKENNLDDSFKKVYTDIIYMDDPGLRNNQDFIDWVSNSEFQTIENLVKEIGAFVDENFYKRKKKPKVFSWLIHLDQDAPPHIHRIYCLN